MIAPFIGSSDIDVLLDHLSMEELETKNISGLYPFLDEVDLETILDDQDLEITSKNIASLAPFLSQKSLVKMVENFSRSYEAK